MSHNADAAYQQGARPLSKWTKSMFVSHDESGVIVRDTPTCYSTKGRI